MLGIINKIWKIIWMFILVYIVAHIIGIIVIIIGIVCFGKFGSTTEGIYDLGNQYELAATSAHEVKIVPESGWTSDTQIIPAKVVELAWNKDYIIAKQLGLKRENDYSDYEIPDKKKVYYWILDVKEKKRHGPYSKKKFEKELKKYHLEHLKMKNADKYR